MGKVVILGIFVADTAYSAPRMPRLGETLIGSGFALGPGGKGSNQAVAAARAGGAVSFISRIGKDTFGGIGLSLWQDAGVTPLVTEMEDVATGAAFIYVNDSTGENAIIVYPGASGHLSPTDVDLQRDAIAAADVFVTQLEQPAEAALRGLRIARGAGVKTVFNPAPSVPFPDDIYALCDVIAPNESEAEGLTGQTVATLDDARRAGDRLLGRGVGAALITLGERGALLHAPGFSQHFPAISAGKVVDTTGAGDAFVGGFAVALSEGRLMPEAVRFGIATASIAVTRRGTAPAMPARPEIDALLAANPA
jgi:ribokinase